MPYNFIWQHYCISRCCCCFCFHLLLKPLLSFSACVSSIHLKLCFHNTGYMIMFIDFSKAFVHFTNCLFISMLRHYSVVLKTNTYPSHLTLLFTSVYAVIFFMLLIVIFTIPLPFSFLFHFCYHLLLHEDGLRKVLLTLESLFSLSCSLVTSRLCCQLSRSYHFINTTIMCHVIKPRRPCSLKIIYLYSSWAPP